MRCVGDMIYHTAREIEDDMKYIFLKIQGKCETRRLVSGPPSILKKQQYEIKASDQQFSGYTIETNCKNVKILNFIF